MNWQVVFIGIIAVSVALIALGQVAVCFVLYKMFKQMAGAVSDLRREIGPLVDKAHRIADDAGRVAELAVVQAERVDRLVASTTAKVDEAVGLLQNTVIRPVKQGAAVMAGVRAALSVLRAWQRRQARPATSDDEDPLFVG